MLHHVWLFVYCFPLLGKLSEEFGPLSLAEHSNSFVACAVG